MLQARITLLQTGRSTARSIVDNGLPASASDDTPPETDPRDYVADTDPSRAATHELRTVVASQ